MILPMTVAGKIEMLQELIESGLINREEAMEVLMGCAEYTVDDWIEGLEISEGQLKRYPNARKAQDIMNSKLYKVMK